MFRSNSTWKWNKSSRKDKIGVESLRENHKELIKSNRLILNTQQRLAFTDDIVFTEEVKKIALSANNDKRIVIRFNTEMCRNNTKKEIK